MEWTVHGERSLYESAWVRLALVDVEIAGGERFEHHVVRVPQGASGTVVHDPARGLLLLWRHRFITGSWGWEVPAGGVDVGEEPADAAAREVLEETGWQPGPLRHLVSFNPSNGLSDQRFHLYAADGATYRGAPSDPAEAERIEWVPVPEVRRLVAAGAVGDGLSLTALCWWLAGLSEEPPAEG